ncbi:MAG TPA: transglycosylase SLT domain-containing protein [Gemmatimonadaceae bacterium]
MKRLVLGLAAALAACSSKQEASAAGDVEQSGVITSAQRDLARAIAQTNEVAAAQKAIDDGHPWRATQIIAPVLKDPTKRTPAALIVAARAAVGWDGWQEVDKLLVKETWLDAQFEGEGRELLTRSSLEQGGDTAALTQARLAIQDAKSADSRGVRNVYYARALERTNFYDSAAVAYSRAAESLRPVRDWLLLRAAGTQRDSADRVKTYAGVRSAVARARIPWTEAQSLERTPDVVGAAAKYAALGATVASLRLRLSAASDSATRNTIRNELLAFIRSKSGTGDARTAVDVLDKGFTSLTPAEQLTIARSSAASGPPTRAVTGFERALTQPNLVSASDRIAYAQALTKVNRSSDALAQFALVTGPLAGSAAYQRARVYLTSSGDQLRSSLRDVISRFPNDTTAASSALYLLADLSTDDGNDDQARTLYQQLYRTYPTSSRAASARLNASVISLAAGQNAAAAAGFDSVITRYPRSEEISAARYWSGRAHAAAGNDATAKLRWRDAISANNVSYYSSLAAKKLGEKPWVPPARGDEFATFPSIDSALARVALLDKLGMDTEQKFELDALDDGATATPDRLAATAHAFVTHGQPSRAIRLAQKLIDAGQRDARSYRLLYPLVDGDELKRAAQANNLDPWLVSGLIRQESSFNPRAVSVANARGLMQVLPSVGQQVATTLRFPVWYPALLLDADANLQLGTAHLAGFIKEYGALPRVLAAYNAGGARVNRWTTKAGTDDNELFVERIPFVETRDYVRIVQRNADVYRMLYGQQ